ncbi:Kinesin-like protein [Aphelenchoides fujianensis]|nr:Kinesin-like protein [Aphelenchoides fujianensis]
MWAQTGGTAACVRSSSQRPKWSDWPSECVQIPRLDGRVHKAEITQLKPADKMVKVEWTEDGERLWKSMGVDHLLRFNPQITGRLGDAKNSRLSEDVKNKRKIAQRTEEPRDGDRVERDRELEEPSEQPPAKVPRLTAPVHVAEIPTVPDVLGVLSQSAVEQQNAKLRLEHENLLLYVQQLEERLEREQKENARQTAELKTYRTCAIYAWFDRQKKALYFGQHKRRVASTKGRITGHIYAMKNPDSPQRAPFHDRLAEELATGVYVEFLFDGLTPNEADDYEFLLIEGKSPPFVLIFV